MAQNHILFNFACLKGALGRLSSGIPLFVLTTSGGHMIEAEIWENETHLWRGQLRDPWTGTRMGEVWSAPSRGELISLMRKWIPLSHMRFYDRVDPLDP